MGQKIILHIGSPKCGSTYLQRVLLNNQKMLQEHGVAYPHDGGSHPGNAASLDKITAAQLKSMFAGANMLVLSHEDLFARAPVAKALAKHATTLGAQVQVVAFLRPFSEFVFGDYSQFMKQHFETFLNKRTPYNGRGFEEFAVDRSRNLAVTTYFKSWGALFPHQRIILGHPKDIRSVIEPLLGVEGLNWDVERHATNPSLRMEDCDRIAAAIRDRSISAPTIKQMFKDAFFHTGQSDAGKTADRIAWLEALFAQQNRNLLEAFDFDNRLPGTGSEPAPSPVSTSRHA